MSGPRNPKIHLLYVKPEIWIFKKTSILSWDFEEELKADIYFCVFSPPQLEKYENKWTDSWWRQKTQKWKKKCFFIHQKITFMKNKKEAHITYPSVRIYWGNMDFEKKKKFQGKKKEWNRILFSIFFWFCFSRNIFEY